MIIRPFNAGFFLLMAVMIGTIVLLWALLRNQPQQRREVVLLTLCVVNIIGFFVYKGFLSADAQFLQVSGLDKFNWFNELPLQLCNINMFLIPLCFRMFRNHFIEIGACHRSETAQHAEQMR